MAQAEAKALVALQESESNFKTSSVAHAAALAEVKSKVGVLEEVVAVKDAQVEALKAEAAAAGRKVKICHGGVVCDNY